MLDRPDAATVLFGLAAFLEQDVRPAIPDAALAFRVRIAAHLAQSMALQQGAEDAMQVAALERLRELFPGVPVARTRVERAAALAELDQRLAAAIRGGTAPEGALAHVRATLADELSVTNPAFDLSPEIERRTR